jgi:hypothetical protein
MHLESLLDVSRFSQSLRAVGSGLFGAWRDTAIEVAPERYAAIGNAYRSWTDTPTNRPLVDQLLFYLEELLVILGDEERQKKFLRAEAFPFIKFV